MPTDCHSRVQALRGRGRADRRLSLYGFARLQLSSRSGVWQNTFRLLFSEPEITLLESYRRPCVRCCVTLSNVEKAVLCQREHQYHLSGIST